MTPEENREYHREYYKKNKDKKLQQCKEYYEQNKTTILDRQKKHYEDNREEKLQRNKEYRQDKKSFIDSHKKPCVVCGEDDIIVIDFHHIDPKEKSFTIGRNGYSKEKIKEEIDKCACLCANCHRRVHAGTVDLSVYT